MLIQRAGVTGLGSGRIGRQGPAHSVGGVRCGEGGVVRLDAVLADEGDLVVCGVDEGAFGDGGDAVGACYFWGWAVGSVGGEEALLAWNVFSILSLSMFLSLF